jgi:hypothetical protein
MADSIQSNSTASAEYDYSDVELDPFWLKEETDNRIDERCSKVVGVLQQSVTRGCNFPEEFMFRSEPWTAADDFHINVIASIPSVIVTLILSILVGILYWIISYAIYRLLKVGFSKWIRHFQLDKESSGSSEKSQIVSTSVQIISEVFDNNNFSPKNMLLKLHSTSKLKNDENSMTTFRIENID